MPVPEHGLERAVWTDADLAATSWEDATIWGFTLERGDDDLLEVDELPTDRLLVDLDVITRRVPPARRGGPYSYWVAPATLVFTGVTDLRIELDTAVGEGWLAVAGLDRVDGGWRLHGAGFAFTVAAPGFRQTVRHLPEWSVGQVLPLADRGGHSYGEVPVEL